jgi:uncharacterized membrane protein YhhN
MNARIFFYGYLAAGLTNVVSTILENQTLNQYSKPLLMPLLLAFVYERSKPTVTIKTLLLAAAIIFAWGGDIALMYPEEYFLAGVASFFVTQVLYIISFRRSTYGSMQLQWVKIIPIILFGVVLFYLLLPNAGNLAIPVFVYGLSLLTMVAFATMREGKTSKQSYVSVLVGAVLFLLSDSMIAIDKFSIDIPFGRTAIMTTYIGAQLLIALGLVKHAD